MIVCASVEILPCAGDSPIMKPVQRITIARVAVSPPLALPARYNSSRGTLCPGTGRHASIRAPWKSMEYESPDVCVTASVLAS